VEFRNPEKVLGGWLPLEAYDDKEFDTRLPSAWLHYVGGMGPRDGVGAQGLWKDKDGLCYWRKLRVLKFLPKTERFEGFWENTREKVRLCRIYILFDEEDPRIFARRFKAANDKRIHADALIKYNYYVENMPKHAIPEIDANQINRVLTMTQNSKALRGKSSADTTTLLNEMNADFAKTMNKIIFDKHCVEKNNQLITGKLELPPPPKKCETPYYGMIRIPTHNYSETFSKFCFRTLLIKDEVIRAQQEIRKECNELSARDIFNTNITKTMAVSEFKQIQTSSLTQTSYYLKETWLNKLKEIITTQFKAGEAAEGQKSWFNLNETDKNAYEQGKLKRFLMQQRFVMEDTLLRMAEKSIHSFVDNVCSFLPLGCIIHNSCEVTNTYYTAEQIKALGAPKPKFPLF
jgi:dynein heavy chain, axonemal